MSEFIKQILRILIPKKLKKVLFNIRNRQLAILQNRILKYYKNEPIESLSEEKKEVIRYLEENPISLFPYDFSNLYKSLSINVFTDIENDLSYVIQENKRLYFERGMTKQQIKSNFRRLQLEQDVNSPHRYLNQYFFVSEGDTVIDVGVAEGNFALSVVDKVKKIYLFETNVNWIEALNATFKPWCDKVIIINKFVSDHNDDFNITLDSMFKEDSIDFIKIDVDGAERELLNGSMKLLTNPNPMKIALCTYHNQNDENYFKELLLSKNFDVEYSNGYMIFIFDELEKLKPPYLRRGLIRAKKRSELN